MNDMALDLTGFVVTFVVIGALSALVLLGTVAGAVVHHRAQRVRRHETVRRYYGRLAGRHVALTH